MLKTERKWKYTSCIAHLGVPLHFNRGADDETSTREQRELTGRVFFGDASWNTLDRLASGCLPCGENRNASRQPNEAFAKIFCSHGYTQQFLDEETAVKSEEDGQSDGDEKLHFLSSEVSEGCQ